MKRYFWRLALMVVAVVVIFALYRRLTISSPPATPFLQSSYPLTIAHRGGAALAPENTLLAFESALKFGADVLEVDVRATADGVLVAFYDETVDRTTGATGKVAEMTLAQVQALDAGYAYSPDNGATFPYRGQGINVPTVREIGEKFPQARLSLKIRQVTPPIEAPLIALIQEMKAQNRILVTSVDEETMKRFRHLDPAIATGAADDEVRDFYFWQRWGISYFYRPVASVLDVPDRWGDVQLITAGFVNAAHAQGMKIYVRSINTPERMRELLNLKVDGIVTDRPDLLRQVVVEAGY